MRGAPTDGARPWRFWKRWGAGGLHSGEGAARSLRQSLGPLPRGTVLTSSTGASPKCTLMVSPYEEYAVFLTDTHQAVRTISLSDQEDW